MTKHLQAVSELPCIICGVSPVEVHHVRTKRYRARDDFKTIPLCVEHHRGQFSIHNCKGRFVEKYGEQVYLLIQVYKILMKKDLLCPEAGEIFLKL